MRCLLVVGCAFGLRGKTALAAEAWGAWPAAGARLAAQWQEQELAAAVERIAATTDAPAWIDRRVDRQRRVTFASPEAPLREVVQGLAVAAGYQAEAWRGVILVAPPGAADEIATLALAARERLAQAPRGVRAQWLVVHAAKWPRLTEPRTLLREWTSAAGIADEQTAIVPHDLWPSGALPPMPLVDRATLLLAGFDLRLEFDAQGDARIVPVTRPVRVTKEYVVAGPRGQEFWRVLEELTASDRVEQGETAASAGGSSRRAAVSTTAAGHAALARALAGQPAAPGERPRGGEQRYTLRIASQPLGAVLDQLARQTGVTIVWPAGADAGVLRATRISCDVHNATQAELFNAIVVDAGLVCELQDGKATFQRRPSK